MRAALFFLLASCAHHSAAPPVGPMSAQESLLVETARDMRSRTPRHQIPPELVVTPEAPTRAVPRLELRRLVGTARDPLILALALTWLSSANDPADIDVMRALATRDDSFLWFGEIRTLGSVALEAAGHVLGVPFALPEQLDDWQKRFPDPKKTPEYWRAHDDKNEELWSRDPSLFLRIALEGSSWEIDLERPSIGSRYERDRRILRRLLVHAEAFVLISDWNDADRARALYFAVRYFSALDLSRFHQTWTTQWQKELARLGSQSLLPLTLLASRSGEGPDALVQTIETTSTNESLLYKELVEKWPAALHDWTLSRGPEQQMTILESLLVHPESRDFVKRIARKAITGMSDRDLFKNLPRAMKVVSFLDPAWQASTDVLDDWTQQKVPGFLAPSIVRTMESMRAQVTTW